MSCLAPEEFVRAAEGEDMPHLKECAHCRKETRKISQTMKWVRELPEAEEFEPAPAPAPEMRWKGTLSIAASLLICFGILVAVFFDPGKESARPIDTSNKSDYNQIDALVARLLAGEQVRDEILNWRRSALPVLAKYRGNAIIDFLIAEIDARTPRVLLVEQSDRPEYRHLKDALLGDPNAFVHCLVLDAKPDFRQEHTPNAEDPRFRTPIREFPKSMADLMTYNVVILGDVDPNAIGGDGAAYRLHRYVNEFGGGLLLISGRKNNPESYRGTGLSRLLPIEAGKSVQAPEQPVRYVLTGKGLANPIFNTEDWNAEKVGALPIEFFYPARKIKPGAQALAEIEGGGQRAPLFVSQHFGGGRVLWSATDETWKWRSAGRFYRLWQNIIDWSLIGKAHNSHRFRLNADKNEYSVGDKVYLSVRGYDGEWNLLIKESLTIEVETPDGKTLELRLSKDSGREGYYQGVFKPKRPGHYKMWIGKNKTDRAYAYFKVSE